LRPGASGRGKKIRRLPKESTTDTARVLALGARHVNVMLALVLLAILGRMPPTIGQSKCRVSSALYTAPAQAFVVSNTLSAPPLEHGEGFHLKRGIKCGARGRGPLTHSLHSSTSQRKSPVSEATP